VPTSTALAPLAAAKIAAPSAAVPYSSGQRLDAAGSNATFFGVALPKPAAAPLAPPPPAPASKYFTNSVKLAPVTAPLTPPPPASRFAALPVNKSVLAPPPLAATKTATTKGWF
jgi:hypothetical protein